MAFTNPRVQEAYEAYEEGEISREEYFSRLKEINLDNAKKYNVKKEKGGRWKNHALYGKME